MSNKLAVQKWREKTKENIVKSMGGKCCKCGYNLCISALHIHHLNPLFKESTISNYLKNPRQIKLIISEIKKCILLCANCHAEYHSNLWKIEDIQIPIIDESIFDKPIKESNLCIVCKKQTKKKIK